MQRVSRLVTSIATHTQNRSVPCSTRLLPHELRLQQRPAPFQQMCVSRVDVEMHVDNRMQ